jgi:hypothetical protein
MTYPLESILLPIQRLQLEHDEAAHRDILSFSLHKRLKHMVLHFYKYAGKVLEASDRRDEAVLCSTLVDAFIICLASANAMNLSLGTAIDATPEPPTLDGLAYNLSSESMRSDVFASAARDLVIWGGQMAKAIESADHLEAGDPRSEMARLVPALTASMLGHLGCLNIAIEAAVRARLAGIERKSIFTR